MAPNNSTRAVTCQVMEDYLFARSVTRPQDVEASSFRCAATRECSGKTQRPDGANGEAVPASPFSCLHSLKLPVEGKFFRVL